METIILLINNYGYIILFCALFLELIAFPLPGETIMTYCGFLIYEGKMNLFTSILVAASAVILGITTSYFAGIMLGGNFFKKYGLYVHLGPKHLERASMWFNLYGSKLIFIAYFIPGVRHITGYFSGITKISYKRFAFTAYLGAVLWCSTFISLGNFLGLNWNKLHSYSRNFAIIGILIISLALIITYIYRNHKTSIIKITHRTIFSTNSMGKIKIALFSIAVILFSFFALYNL